MFNRQKQKVKNWIFKNLAFPIILWIWRSCTLRIFINSRIHKREEALKYFYELPTFILASWHQNLLIIPHLLDTILTRPLSAVISKSRDGQMLSSIQTHFSNVNVIEVAHDNKQAALGEIVKEIKNNRIIAITPDGPRGPWKRAKPGLFFAAKQTACPIVTIAWGASKEWKLPSPDHMRLPFPFAKIDLFIEEVESHKTVSTKELTQKVQENLEKA